MSNELANLIINASEEPEDMWRQGVITNVVGTTLTVQIGGAATPVAGLRYFGNGYVPAINDVVHLLPYGSTFVVMGKLA